MNERIVITGASGLIGYHVAVQLLQSGYKPLLLVRGQNRNIVSLKKLGADVHIVDFRDAASYSFLLRNADVLFHVASENTTATKETARIIASTYGLTRNIVDAAINESVKKIVYTSSVVVLGRSRDPLKVRDENDKANYFESPYVRGKFLAEEYCNKLIEDNKADIRRVYPSWVLGSNDEKNTPPKKLIKSYLKKGQWVYFNGGISVACAEEVARVHINSWLKGRQNGKYIAAGNNITFKEFFTALAQNTGYIKPFIFLPRWIMYAASVVLRFLRPGSSLHPRYVKSVVGAYSWYNSERSIHELGYAIPPLDVMITKSVQDLKTGRRSW